MFRAGLRALGRLGGSPKSLLKGTFPFEATAYTGVFQPRQSVRWSVKEVEEMSKENSTKGAEVEKSEEASSDDDVVIAIDEITPYEPILTPFIRLRGE